jgi:hypothetical protein
MACIVATKKILSMITVEESQLYMKRPREGAAIVFLLSSVSVTELPSPTFLLTDYQP